MDTALELELKEDIAFLKSLREVSEYELERGKPMSTTKHGSVQANLLGLLISRYKAPSVFRFRLRRCLSNKSVQQKVAKTRKAAVWSLTILPLFFANTFSLFRQRE